MTNPTANLQLITNDRFKKTLQTKCTVQMFDTVETFNEDFVALAMKDGKPCLRFDADTVTLGMAWVMIGQAFKKNMDKLPQNVREEVIELLAEG